MTDLPFDVSAVDYDSLSPADQREFKGLLEDLRRHLERNPLNGYVPYEKQIQFHAAKQRTRMFIGGNRTGKTTSAAADDLIQVLPPELVPPHLKAYKKYGHDDAAKIRVITPDLTDTMESVLEKYREVCPAEALRGGSWDKAFDKVKRNLHFKRGDRINFMSTEQDPNKFGGQAFHRIHFDEEPSGPNAWKIYRESRMRLIDYGGDMVFSMTPLMETDWIEDKLWEQRGSDRVFGVQASMRDNPYLSEAEIEEALADLTAEERQAVEHGQFVSFAGKFYPEFTRELHVRPPVDAGYLENMDIVVGIDPGSRTGVVWVAFDNDNVALVFDEFFPDGMVVPDIATEIKKRNEMWGIEPSYVIDPASRIRTGPSQEQFTTEYARHQIYCGSGQNERGPGIMEIKRRLQKEGLFFTEDVPNVIFQMSRYRRDADSGDEWKAVKQTVTTRFDLLDSLRYSVLERTWHIPKTFRNKRSNYNADPFFEPPWTGPVPQDSPPLGAYS